MFVTVFTVTMLALSVIMLVMLMVLVMLMMLMMLMVVVMLEMLEMVVMNRFVAVALVLKAEGQRGLVPGCHVEPVLFLQLPSGLIPLRLQLSQSSSDKLLLQGWGGTEGGWTEVMKRVK